MLKLRQIIYASLKSTNRFPRWWILALAEVAGFFIIGRLTRPDWQFFPWLPAVVVFLLPIITWLWLDIEAVKTNQKKSVPPLLFIRYCLISGSIMLCSIIVIILSRLLYLHWAFLALFSSLVAATATLAMLYVVLCGQNFYSSWALALDTWHKKFSLALLAAFVLIVAHGVSFAFAHAFWDPALASGEFSAFGHSATIWLISACLVIAIAYIAALLNCFLVFLFLEIVNRKKNPEAVERVVMEQPAFEGNH